LSSRAPHRRRLVLGLLALWLGLWPGADAVTGTSRLQALAASVARGDAPAALQPDHPAQPVGRCCAAAPDRPTSPSFCSAAAATGARSCEQPTASACQERSESPAPPTGCPLGKSARCASCCGPGGMVLFVAASPTLEADRAVVGLIDTSGKLASSRHLKPPVPPPWSDA